MRRIVVLLLGFAFVAILLREVSLMGSGETCVFFFDIGQGDAAMIVSPSGKQIVIDGGRDLTLLRRLGTSMPLLDRSIDLLVLSHPNLDHIAAFPEILRRYRVRAVLLTGVAFDLSAYEEFLRGLEREGAAILFADPARDIDLGDGLVLDVVWPASGLEGKEVEEVNDTSIVLRAIFGEHEILFTGDIEERAETAILASGEDIDADILKVPHHGSKTSSSTGFLLAISPDLAVISVAAQNSYGHPHPSVLERFAALGILARTTAEDGTICLQLPAEGGAEDC